MPIDTRSPVWADRQGRFFNSPQWRVFPPNAGAFVHQQIIWGEGRSAERIETSGGRFEDPNALRPAQGRVGPRRPDPVPLLVEARTLLHGLASSEAPAEGGRADAAVHLGDAVLRQGRAARPSDAETARRVRHPDAPACRPRRGLLRALRRVGLADHGGRG